MSNCSGSFGFDTAAEDSAVVVSNGWNPFGSLPWPVGSSRLVHDVDLLDGETARLREHEEGEAEAGEDDAGEDEKNEGAVLFVQTW